MISTLQYCTSCACHFIEYLFQQLYYAFCLEDAITAFAHVSPTCTDINYFPCLTSLHVACSLFNATCYHDADGE